jgi:MscS family membrane protein
VDTRSIGSLDLSAAARRARHLAWHLARLAAVALLLARPLHAEGAWQGVGTLLQGDSVAWTDSTAEAPDSPRAAVREFLRLSERGDYTRAARFLALDRRRARRGAELAQRLHAVMQRWVLIDLRDVSPLGQGDPSDGEPPLQDRIGRTLPGVSDAAGPMTLVKVTERGESRWLFSREVVGEIDTAYAMLDTSWTQGRLPASLRTEGPLGFARWKWIGVLFGLPLVWLLAAGIGVVLRGAATAVVRRTRLGWGVELSRRLRGPVRLLVASVLCFPLVRLLELDFSTTAALWRGLRGVATLAVFWALLRSIGLAEDHLARKASRADHTHARTIIPLIGRSLRIAVAALALLVTVAQFGYPVGTLLAGLGIGGIAVALAAQKTVENLFGSVSLAADRVFRVGDWVQVEGVQGSVETIGLRSTHLRTLDRTLVKIPNGRLAEMRVESFGERDRIRFFTTLRLVYGTSTAQLRRVVADVDALLRAYPRVWPDNVAVRFVAIAPYSFDVNVTAWLLTTDATEFEVMRQELLLGVMEVVEQAGTALALPSQTLQVEPTGAALLASAGGR